MLSLLQPGDLGAFRHYQSSRTIPARSSLQWEAQEAVRNYRLAPDFHYILQVIDFLRNQRELKGISHLELTRAARLRKGVIALAENDNIIPTSSEFRAWARALDLEWAEVWSKVMSSRVELSC